MLVDGVERFHGTEAVDVDEIVGVAAFVVVPALVLLPLLRGAGMGAVDDACSSKFLIILVN